MNAAETSRWPAAIFTGLVLVSSVAGILRLTSSSATRSPSTDTSICSESWSEPKILPL